MTEQNSQVPDVTDPGQSCPEGYELIDGRCVKVSSTPPEIECPPGYELVDGVCVRSSAHRQ